MSYTKVIIKSEADLPKHNTKVIYFKPFNGIYEDRYIKSLKKDWLRTVPWYLIEDTEPSYPEGFIMWFEGNIIPNSRDDTFEYLGDDDLVVFYTFKEVYEYWLNEIKNK